MPKPIDVSAEIRPEAPTVARLSTIERSILQSQVIEQIKTVYDPEIPVNVYDLGLIYDVRVADNRDVHIVMTLTSPMCPVAGSLPGEVECAARATDNVGQVSVELTWDPPFTIDSIPEETRLMLGFE
jgi:FeS assembly SUF system protein